MAKAKQESKSYLYVDEDNNEGTVDVLDPIDGDILYTVDECAKVSYEVFGVGPDVVRAAFAYSGITEATKAQALEIVAVFKAKTII